VSIRIVRLGTERLPGEGLRIGTVRHPPRGVPKSEHASRDFYDVWYPEFAPSAENVKLALHAATDKEWSAFVRKFRAEMSAPEKKHTLDLFAALSHQACFSIGCYCEEEARCHRSVLRELLAERGAKIE